VRCSENHPSPGSTAQKAGESKNQEPPVLHYAKLEVPNFLQLGITDTEVDKIHRSLQHQGFLAEAHAAHASITATR